MGFGDFIKDQFIDLIEYVDGGQEKSLVHKYIRVGDEIKQGARLIVRNGQAAVFVHRGQIADILGAGNYRLDTGNLKKIIVFALVVLYFVLVLFFV